MVQGVTEKLLVPFAGEGSGTGGLSWGQKTIWRAFEAAGSPIWLTGLRAVPAGSTIDYAVDELAFVMSRNQALRSTLLVPDDGEIQQVVHASGKAPLQIVDVDDDNDPRLIAKAIEEEWLERDLVYDYANDWPVKMVVVRHRGAPAYLVRAMSHVTIDGFGAVAMHADMDARDPVTGLPSGPNTSMEPLEQAQWQASPAGQRRSRISEQHWQRLLRSIPARRFPEPASQPAHYGRFTFDSRAAFLAIQAIGSRTEVDTSPVLLAAFAAGLARVAGINPVVPRVYVSNRFWPRLAATVSPIAQTCPCVIDLSGGITFDEAVKRTYYASLAAYKHAYFEPVKIRELLAATSEERGEQIDLSFVYNDSRLDFPREASRSPVKPADIRAALPLSTLRWEERAEPEDFCNIMIQDSKDTINAMVLVHGEYVARGLVEAFLREMEAVVVEAACDPKAGVGI
jgi:hypothetical protein